MTSVGKILVIMNLLLSALTCGMIALVFTTRTNWKNEYEKVLKTALVAEAAYKSETLRLQNEFNSHNSETESMRNSYKANTDELARLRGEIVKKDKQIAAAEQVNKDTQTTQLSQQGTIDVLTNERKYLTAQYNKIQKDLLDMQKELESQRLLAVTNRIEADTQKQRAQQLLNRLEEVEKSNTQLTNKLISLGGNVGSGTDSLLNPKPTPAPADVKGTVTAVGASGIAVVSIGSDSGISKGNRLFVYRNDAQGPLYLGEIEIKSTEPKQAAGQFIPKPYAKASERLPRVDDIVATSLGSGR